MSSLLSWHFITRGAADDVIWVDTDAGTIIVDVSYDVDGPCLHAADGFDADLDEDLVDDLCDELRLLDASEYIAVRPSFYNLLLPNSFRGARP